MIGARSVALHGVLDPKWRINLGDVKVADSCALCAIFLYVMIDIPWDMLSCTLKCVDVDKRCLFIQYLVHDEMS
jgi:hypothetical protein